MNELSMKNKQSLSDLHVDLASRFMHVYGRLPQVEAQAPGRVNLLGEHVDYNDGIVLPAAIDRAVKVAAVATSDNTVTLNALDIGKRVSFRLADVANRISLNGQDLPG